MTVIVHAGDVILSDNSEVEVWLHPCTRAPDGFEHVTLFYGGSQISDFAYNTPCQHDLMQVVASRVVTHRLRTGERIILHLTDEEEDNVIDYNDTEHFPN